VQRWEKEEGLPVHRHNHLQRGTVHAWSDEVDAWRRSRELPAADEPEEATSAPIAPVAPAPPSRWKLPTGRWWVPAFLALFAALFLVAALSGAMHRTPAPPKDDADAVLGARYLLHRDRPEDVRRAMERCQSGLALAPKSAALHECLAHGHLLLTRNGAEPEAEGLPRARAEAERALALDPKRTVAKTVRAWSAYLLDWRAKDAERAFREAIAEAPSDDAAAAALPQHGLATLLSAAGRHDEAIAALRRAQALEPLSAALNDDGCWFFYRARRYGEALVEADRALALEPERVGAHFCVVDARAELGDLAGARDAAAALLRSVGDSDAARIGALDGGAALTAFRRRLLSRLEERSLAKHSDAPPMPMAMLHGELGDREETVRWLEKGLAARDSVILLVRVHPCFDAVRGDPRVSALLARAGV
jgi:serine/threonine-protein kinase